METSNIKEKLGEIKLKHCSLFINGTKLPSLTLRTLEFFKNVAA